MRNIDTRRFSEALRRRAIDKANQRILVARIAGSDQERDLTEPPNCGGLGRLRHFRRYEEENWPQNPLPIDPACKALSQHPGDELVAQVFQNAACNWRCWYCFVPFKLLSADSSCSQWLTTNDMVELYLAEPSRAAVLDLTGGQPDLVPEWVPWMMKELEARGLDSTTYLWSDDNLSTDFFWTRLSKAEITRVRNYTNYGRVCCFKGFDPCSFAFNTSAAPNLFEHQFSFFRRFVDLGIDVYAYVTFTSPDVHNLDLKMRHFVDQLQRISEALPLRTVPLKIRLFTPLETENRLEPKHHRALQNQQLALEAWRRELDLRFGEERLDRDVSRIPL